jgi:uroporphyrinogen III methyltransferase/synthase
VNCKLGVVYLVGAGPGDPGLITVRGAECLQKADLVLYDYLVNALLLDYAPGAEKVSLGHHHAGRELPQDEINHRMIDAARQGKIVVRLKGGDPHVFGRGADEIEALTAAGIPYEIVPGVTAALAAAGYAEIPITHGRLASAIALVTGHQRSDKSDPLDYGALASFPGTLVFYMGVRSADRWSRALLDQGKSPDTPAAIIRRCSFADQKIVRCTLGTIVNVIAREKLRPPAIVIVGEVVDLAPAASWFDKRPLAGQTILVTRPRLEILRRPTLRVGACHDDVWSNQNDLLGRHLRELGANVLGQPVIRISDPPDWQPVDAAIARLSDFDWIVFSSANGVRWFLNRQLATGGDLRRLGGVKVAAIGPATAEELLHYHLRADVIPSEFRAEALADSLAGEALDKRFLLVRASRGREVLAEQLTAAGAIVEQVVAYTSSDVTEPDPDIGARLAAGMIDWITVSSSSIARALVNLFGENLRHSKLASISPVTSKTLRELGYEPAVEAEQYTMPGLVDAICRGVN